MLYVPLFGFVQGRLCGERRTRTEMLFVIRMCLLYLQTVLITTGPGARKNRMQVSNMFTVNLMFGLLKRNSWRLTYLATEMSLNKA